MESLLMILGRSNSFSLIVFAFLASCNQPKFNADELKRAQEFLLSNLEPLQQDISNRFADDKAAADLGKGLFFDTGMSANEQIACASCHQPEKGFQDNLPVGIGIGETQRRTMPLAGAQWSNWFFWDGRKDSQWSQALEPLETPQEHGMTRDMVARHVLNRYRTEYEAIFGAAPSMARWPYFASPLLPGLALDNWKKTSPVIQNDINQVFANTGKALAAFQRTLLPKENRFDRAIASLNAGQNLAGEDKLTDDEIAGFKLFIGKAKCDNCHSGPLFSDQFFHNNGAPVKNPDAPDLGRALAVQFLKLDAFSCAGKFSDAKLHECRELNFMSDDPSIFEGSFKTPTLRGVADRAPYMHAGQVADLEAVIDLYSEAPDPFSNLADIDGKITPHGRHSEAKPLDLSVEEKRQLLAFVKIL